MFSLRDFERLQEGRVACVVGGRKFDPCLCDIRHKNAGDLLSRRVGVMTTEDTKEYIQLL